MATIVVEALLSASVEVLLKKIVSGEFLDFFRSTKLDLSLLEKLKITLLSLQAVLHDAEEKQISNPAVKEWLVLLQDAVFEADDLFDEINTVALRCKVKAKYKGKTATAKVRNILSCRFKRFNGVINSKMQKLFKRLEFLRKQKLGLKEGISSSVWHRTPTSSVVDESSIYGRDSDRKKLKGFLLAEDAGCKIGVVSVVGMGGLGKTTLAKLLYNDPEVKEKFALKAWAHISKDFDVVRVTKTLLESITSRTIDNDSQLLESVNLKGNDSTNDLNTLQVQLQRCLSNKLFLLVLDDIWYGSYVDWNNLMAIFNVGETGSKIIITTRDERVALAMQTFLPIHSLTPLESEDCWSILAKHAFGASNYQQRSNLEEIGKDISKKCNGLPLAATTLGGLLRFKLSQDYWNDVLKSSIWELTDGEVQPALLMSYRYLPAPLKRCFAYCSLFPKSSILKKNMLVQLWIAEGLVLQPNGEKSWEKVADEYFDELVSRSLIQQRCVDGKTKFHMHDLIIDLATMVSSSYCIRLDEEKLHERTRHLSYNREEFDPYNKFDKLHRLKGLRTFLSLPLQDSRNWYYYSVSDKVICDLLPAMKQLRVLSLSCYKSFTELPTSIGNLIYLRYLNLSHTWIKRLPSEICELYNMQTLLLTECRNLIELPEDMGKLVNLRHLDIRGTWRLMELPVQIAKLENLQTLSDFIVGKQHDGLKVGELGKFSHLHGKLSISQLQNVTHPSAAFQANLEMKKQIDDLILEWESELVCATPSDPQIENVVLEQLRPSTNLKNLTIKNYSGNTFPNWLSDSLFGNMVYLKISNCRNCSWCPPLGQLGNLKELTISLMPSIKTVGNEFYGSSSSRSFQSFPSLETLQFKEMSEWEEWKLIVGTSTKFPSLLHLSLDTCPKLKGNIPHSLPSLTELKLQDCPHLVEFGNSNDNSNNMIIMPSSDVVFRRLMLSPLNSLLKLTISCFPYLTSFPRDGLPKNLQSLTIFRCNNLEFLSHESLHNHTSLEELKISHSCNAMTSFSLGSLPVLKSLFIERCKNLKSISVEDVPQQSLLFLTSIKIKHCDELQFFSLGGFPTPNLIYFEVRFCKKLCSVPEPMNNLAGLQVMKIDGLPNLQSFAKDGLPINLVQLSLGSVGGILWNTTWERLTCLSLLVIKGDRVNAPMKMDVPRLPVSLISLKLHDLDDIECLDGKLLHHLISLQKLEITSAPKLKLLPDEGLPSSLSVLSIVDCPLLEASLLRKRGKEWRKIAHIPSIIINYKVIT
ncbi:unnamed protein product [Trifolium pratense]|uniref:Uncharacterized protein n=1 Tax=Trifolium pratense TaxID=57577 RepID=A0ACB0J1J5_TRIPR|nr:unnamed protein product [Trifolium pratense]